MSIPYARVFIKHQMLFLIDCPSGTYGNGCSKECSCLTTRNCDPVTGECLCPSGFRGPNCNASKYQYLEDEHLFGNLWICSSRAHLTFFFTGCDEGYYGPGCRKQCECSKTGTCDRFDGSCDCDRGWVGSTCEQSKYRKSLWTKYCKI